jgi:hypothetical protein
MRPVSLHTAAWRYPGAWPDANFNFQHLKYFARNWNKTASEALEKRAQLDSLGHYESAIASLSIAEPRCIGL